jgi:PPM family protein phosphatase
MPDTESGTESKAPLNARLTWSGLTDVGRYRKNNEDAFLALTLNAREVTRLGKLGESDFERGDFVFAVSDGMGGHKAGEFASRIAVEKITELAPSVFRMDAMGLRRGSADLLDHLFSEIHKEIIAMGRAYEECRDMGTTLSMCWFQPEWMHFCHVGDSRIYYLPKAGGIKQLTHDHTHVGWLLRTGQITETQARFHPGRNQLSQALAAGHQRIDTQQGAVGYEPGDRFVLCTDGLIDGLSPNGIDHLIRDRPERVRQWSRAESLVRESVLGSGRDNTTAVVVEILE